MSDSEFAYFKGVDSVGYDAMYVGKKSVEELMNICKQNKRCVAFNTLGYMKFFVHDKAQFKKISMYKEDADFIDELEKGYT